MPKGLLDLVFTPYGWSHTSAVKAAPQLDDSADPCWVVDMDCLPADKPAGDPVQALDDDS